MPTALCWIFVLCRYQCCNLQVISVAKSGVLMTILSTHAGQSIKFEGVGELGNVESVCGEEQQCNFGSTITVEGADRCLRQQLQLMERTHSMTPPLRISYTCADQKTLLRITSLRTHVVSPLPELPSIELQPSLLTSDAGHSWECDGLGAQPGPRSYHKTMSVSCLTTKLAAVPGVDL